MWFELFSRMISLHFVCCIYANPLLSLTREIRNMGSSIEMIVDLPLTMIYQKLPRRLDTLQL